MARLTRALVSVAASRPASWYLLQIASPVDAPRGRTGEYLARTADGEERERLWREMLELYPGFSVYRGRTSGEREIPIVVLSRA